VIEGNVQQQCTSDSGSNKSSSDSSTPDSSDKSSSHSNSSDNSSSRGNSKTADNSSSLDKSLVSSGEGICDVIPEIKTVSEIIADDDKPFVLLVCPPENGYSWSRGPGC
jgi:hypothetical protein